MYVSIVAFRDVYAWHCF